MKTIQLFFLLTLSCCFLTKSNAQGASCNAQYNYSYGQAEGTGLILNFTSTSTGSGSIVAYSWNFGDPNSIGSNGNTSALQNPSHMFQGGGVYKVCLTIATSDGCSSSICDSVFIPVVDPGPCYGLSAIWTDVQSGTGTVQFSGMVDNRNTVNYVWSFGDGTSGTGINVTHTYAAAGSYNVCLTASIPGSSCTLTSCATVAVTAQTCTASISAGGPTSFCSGGSVTLTAKPANAVYAWNTGATTRSITVSNTGSYIVTVTNSNGCIKASAPKNVTVHPLPAAVITTSGNTCPGAVEILTAKKVGTSTYAWSTGATTRVIDVTTAGSYSVTVTTAAHCSAADTTFIPVCDPLPPGGGAVAGKDDNTPATGVSSNLQATIYPNPYTSEFHLKIQSPSTDNIVIRVFDVNGRLIEQRENVLNGTDMMLGNTYAPGMYIMQIRQGEVSQQVRMAKIE